MDKSPETHLWLLRAGPGGRDANAFWDASVVGVALPPVEGLADIPSDDAKAAIQQALLSAEEATSVDRVMTPARAQGLAALLLRFIHEIEEGDRVVTTDGDTGEFLLGVVAGPYEFHREASNDLAGYHHRRKVEWIRRVQASEIPAQALATLRSPMSLYRPGAESVLLGLPGW